MSDTVECKGCHTQIDPSWVSCPVCMRPRSRREIMRDIISTQQEPLRRRRVLWRRLALAAVAAAAVWAAWQQRAGLLGRVLGAKEAVSSWLGRYSYRGKALPPAPPPQASSPPPAALPAAASAEAPAPAPAPAAASPAAASVPDQPPAAPRLWTVRGLAYDLFSLKPVAGAQVSFTSRLSAESFRARTDASGRYTLRLAPLREGGYDVAVRHRDYREEYLEENSPPYRTMSLARRREEASALLQTAVLHVPFLPPEKEVVEKPAPDASLMPGAFRSPEEPRVTAVPQQPQAAEFRHDLVLLPR